jgi:hypothetical protein
MSEPRKPTPYLLRFVMINALLGISIYEAHKQGGQITGKILALYIGIAVVANVLMYFGARARRNLIQR